MMSVPTPPPESPSDPPIVTGFPDMIDLVGPPTSAVVLCGQIIPDGFGEPSEMLRVLTGPDQVFDYPRDLTDVIEYFQVLREERAAREYLAAEGAPADVLDDMIASGQLLRIRSADDGRRLDFSAAVRLEPMSVIWEGSTIGDIYVTPARALNAERFKISDFLASVIYTDDERSTVMDRLAAAARDAGGMPIELAVRSLSSQLPALIAGRYVSFRHVR